MKRKRPSLVWEYRNRLCRYFQNTSGVSRGCWCISALKDIQPNITTCLGNVRAAITRVQSDMWLSERLMLRQIKASARQGNVIVCFFCVCEKIRKMGSHFKKSCLPALYFILNHINISRLSVGKVVKLNTLMRDNPLFLIHVFIQNKMNMCATIAVC